MKAMILAAGRGTRMGKITEVTPKSLLPVGGQPLITYHFANLVRAGITDVVINVCHLADLMKETLGNGERYGVNIRYSEETRLLETGGGIYYALPLLGMEPFIVINSDVFTTFPLKSLLDKPNKQAHLVLVPNPEHVPNGDYGLQGELVSRQAEPKYTFSGIGVYKPSLFENVENTVFRLPDVINPACLRGEVSGEVFTGVWHDVGTPERLEKVKEQVT